MVQKLLSRLFDRQHLTKDLSTLRVIQVLCVICVCVCESRGFEIPQFLDSQRLKKQPAQKTSCYKSCPSVTWII